MTLKIEAKEIIHNGVNFKRIISVTDDTWACPIFERTIYAVTKEELEIIDYENFMKE